MREWYVLQSKPRQEGLAASVLLQAGIETYLPTVTIQGDREQPARRQPFFPGYFFGHLDPERSEIRRASYSPGVLSVVGYGGFPYPVPENLVNYIRERLVQGHRQPGGERFRSGERLVIVSGPLNGLEAIFDRQLSGGGRVRVLIRILAKLCPAEVRAEQVRHVS